MRCDEYPWCVSHETDEHGRASHHGITKALDQQTLNGEVVATLAVTLVAVDPDANGFGRVEPSVLVRAAGPASDGDAAVGLTPTQARWLSATLDVVLACGG